MLPRLLPECVLRSVAVPSSLLVLVLCSATIPAQMSGAYTIDPNGTGSRNFKTFSDATKQLFFSGVNGAVTITVANGTYKESWGVFPITRTSVSATVTFKSATPLGAKLQPTVRETVTFVHATALAPLYDVTLDGFDFIPGAVTNTYPAVVGGAYCDGIEIRNCRFQGPPGQSRLLSTTGTGGSYATNWRIHHNEFHVIDMFRGLYLIYPTNFDIYQNSFVLKRCLSGLQILSRRDSGLRVYNNVFTGNVDDRDPNNGAIVMGTTSYGIEIAHNTMLIDSIMGAAIVLVRGDRDKAPSFTNNILVNTGGGPALRIQESNTAYWQSDGNLFWAPGNTNNLIEGNLGKRFASLSAWQTAVGHDKNSIAGDPLFVNGKTQPFDLHIKRESPAKDKGFATPTYVQRDFAGKPRDTKPDIGAYEVQPFVPFKVFGQGCAGAGGKVPAIGMTGELKLGSKNFFVTLGNARGGSGVSAFFALGVTKSTVNFGGGCTLLVTPNLLLRLPVSGLSGAGNGSSSLKLLIPNNPKLKGATAHVQWGVVDPAAAGIGIAFSNGATLSL